MNNRKLLLFILEGILLEKTALTNIEINKEEKWIKKAIKLIKEQKE